MGMTRISKGRGELEPAKKLRVLHVVDKSFGHRFSGHTHFVFSLLSGWRDEDIVLDLWGSSVRPVNIRSGSTDYQLASELWQSSTKRRSRWTTLPDTARQLWFLLVHNRSYDVAHFHSLGWGTLVSAPLLHLLGKKAVFNSTLYDSDNPSAVWRSRRGALAGRLFSRFDAILTISPRLAEDFMAYRFKNVACIPHFLTLPGLQRGRDEAAREAVRKEYAIPPNATVLLFVGSVIRRKGVDLLAECFARLASRHPDLWTMVVGPNSRAEMQNYDQEFIRSVIERIDQSGAASRVIWTGTVRDKRALSRYYSAADIFVFPTRAEGLANVLIEASAAGLPIVATNLRGITDIPVAHGETGFLVPCEDSDRLTQAVDQLITDTPLRARMGLAARARSERFGFDDYCRQLKAFYLKAAER